MADQTRFAELISYITHLSAQSLSREQIHCVFCMLDNMGALKTDPTSLDRLLSIMKSGSKIEAIKEYRALTGLSLKESKDAIDCTWTQTSHYTAA